MPGRGSLHVQRLAQRGFASQAQQKPPSGREHVILVTPQAPVMSEALKERAANLDPYIHVIAKQIVPNPNYKSNASALVFGRKNGSLRVNMRGQYAGQWYDFDDGRGGNAYDLIREYADRSGESAVKYGESIVAEAREPPICLIEPWMPDWAGKKIDDDDENDEVELIEGENEITGIHGATVPLRPVALRYLTESRKIPLGRRVELSKDVRFLQQRRFKDHCDSIVVLARDSSGHVQALQQTYITPSGTKSLASIPRRSRGSVGGSFVLVNKPTSPQTPKCPVFFAEGLETALTVAAAFDNWFPVYQTMGKSNFHNIPEFLRRDTPVIAVVDNDGPASAKADPLPYRLRKPDGPERHWVVRPSSDLLGRTDSDYNDVLRSGQPLGVIYDDIQRQCDIFQRRKT